MKTVTTPETLPFQKTEQREHLLDNLKFLLITLVVFGHFIEHYTNQVPALKALFVCIYLFHMPLFVFISGYFSKSENSLKIENNIKQLLIPYILFSALWYLLESRHTGYLNIDVFDPPFHLWYLLSLFFWKLLLPAVKKIKYYFLLSIIVAIAIGFNQNINHYLSLSRTISLFPFFLLGNLCTRESLAYIRSKKLLLVAVTGLVTATACYVVKVNPTNLSLLFWDSAYNYSGYATGIAALARLMLLMTAVIVSAGFIIIVPKKEYFFTSLGTRTLPIFIFHAFFLGFFIKYFPVWNQSAVRDMVIVSFPFLLTFLLATPVVETGYKLFFDFVGRKTMRLDNKNYNLLARKRAPLGPAGVVNNKAI